LNSNSLEQQLQNLFQASVQKRAVPAQEVRNIYKLTGDASTRSYYRIITDQDSYVACHDPTLAQQAEPRVITLQNVLADHGVNVPRFLDVEKSQNYILQEDLGDQTMLQELALIKTIDEEHSWPKKALDQLIKIHSIDPRRYQNSCFVNESFDRNKLMWEVEFTVKNFIRAYLKYQLTDVEEAIIKDAFEKLCLTLSAGPMVLCHRDFHSRNIMVKGRKIFLIDFQDARMGTPLYDLVSLLEDCYYRYQSENVEKMKTYYWNKFLKKRKIFKSKKEFEHLYSLMAIQRIFKAIGSFSYFATEKQNSRYLKYIGYSFENLKYYLLQNPRLGELRKLLCRIYYAS
jgi:N-acetylmuramate 1-kinase